MPRQIYKGRVIAIAGELPGQFTSSNLKAWITARKGKFTTSLDENVTHLLCTHEQYKKRVPRIIAALKRGGDIAIVHYDWFEFSTVWEKRQPISQYLMKNIIAKRNAIRREQDRLAKGQREGERSVNSNLFHVYYDRDYFPYQIELTRNDVDVGESGQKYTLTLWESDARPHLYWFTAKFLKKRGNSQPMFHRPSDCSGKWRLEMDHFKEFFQVKTGIEWEDRVSKEMTMPSPYFQYSPPTGGKPVGRRLRFSYDFCREINAEVRGFSADVSQDKAGEANSSRDKEMFLAHSPTVAQLHQENGTYTPGSQLQLPEGQPCPPAFSEPRPFQEDGKCPGDIGEDAIEVVTTGSDFISPT